MGEPEDKREDPAGPESTENSEHGVRNSTHPDLLKPAVDRRRHGAYIDAMLERTTSDKAEAALSGAPRRTRNLAGRMP